MVTISMTSRFTRIHFLDDFLRSDANQLLHHAPNLRAIAALFGSAAERAGIPTSRSLPLTAGGDMDVALHMRSLGLPCSPEGWARACDVDLTPWLSFSPLAALTPDVLVIGWCLSASMIRFLDERGMTFIDFEIAPVRFCRHLKLWARTNDESILCSLESWADDPDDPWLEAAVIRSSAARQGSTSFGDGGASVGIFAGQTLIDLALLENGRIRSVHEVIDEVAKLARTVDVFAIKPHPYAEDVTPLRDLAAAIPNAVWTRQNLYSLFCADNVKFVCALSSGALHEASYFGKLSHALIKPDRSAPEKLPLKCSSWIMVSPGVASLTGLQQILAATGAGVESRGALLADTHVMRDALDRIFKQRWALDDLNKDLFAIEMDRQYDFNSGAPVLDCLAHGWAQPEEWGIWSSSAAASLCLPFRDAPSTARVKIDIDGQVFAADHERHPSVAVRAVVAGVAQQTFDVPQNGHCEITVDFQSTEKVNSFVSLEFLIEKPISPASLGMGGDERALGFGLRTLRASFC